MDGQVEGVGIKIMDEPWKTILALTGAFIVIAGAVGGFLRWHFTAVADLKSEIHKLELKFSELKSKDDLQQTTIDRLSELFPILNAVMGRFLQKNRNEYLPN